MSAIDERRVELKLQPAEIVIVPGRSGRHEITVEVLDPPLFRYTNHLLRYLELKIPFKPVKRVLRTLRRRQTVKLKPAESAFLTGEMLKVANRMSSSEYKDFTDLMQILVADYLNPYEVDGEMLRLRIRVNWDKAKEKAKQKGLDLVELKVYATFSPKAEAVVIYAHGLGCQLLPWAQTFHERDKQVIAACKMYPDKMFLLIVKVTTFGMRPDLIRKFGLV